MSSSGNEGESVRCVVRVRPPNQRELDHGFRSILSVLADKQTICLHSKPDEKRFTFDFCGDATTTQDEMFARVGKPISETCLTGYNGLIVQSISKSFLFRVLTFFFCPCCQVPFSRTVKLEVARRIPSQVPLFLNS
jgi:hypothetical protein